MCSATATYESLARDGDAMTTPAKSRGLTVAARIPHNVERHARLAVVVSEIAIALISGGSALGGAIVGASGAIAGSLIAQRAEKRRRRQESRAALIAQWRNDIRQLRNAENNHLARNEENKKQGRPEEPDPPEVDPWQHYEPLRRLRHELPRHAVSRVDELRGLRVRERTGQIPDLLEQEVLHIETKKWKLPESPV
jgi:hypothetical protein